MGSEPADTQANGWSFYVVLLLVVVTLGFASSLRDVSPPSKETSADSNRQSALLRGDVSARLALAMYSRPPYARQCAEASIKSYSEALPWPAARRRIGIAKHVFLGQSGVEDLMLIGSKVAASSLDARRKARLAREVEMWREIYGPRALSAGRAGELAGRVRRLNLGPLQEPAIAEVYARAGDIRNANAVLKRAQAAAAARIGVLAAVVLCWFLGGLIGLALLVSFLSRENALPGVGDRPKVWGPVAFPAFYYFLILTIGFSALAGQVVKSTVGELLATMATSLAAFGIAMALLRSRARRHREDYRVIGLKPVGIGTSVKWGVGGYCAAIPVLVMSLVVAMILQNTVFRGYAIREHPIVPVLLSSRPAFWLSLVVGVVVAPIVEEVMFRGALYTALRSHLSTWGAAVLSGAVFSAIHPTMPAGFLPILTLGIVLAVLREKTGSLYPSMVCHAVNNALMLVAAALAY